MIGEAIYTIWGQLSSTCNTNVPEDALVSCKCRNLIVGAIVDAGN